MREWSRVTIGSIASVWDGPHATPKKTASGPWYLSISSLQAGRLDLGESAHIAECDFPVWTRRIQPQDGDLLFSYETRLGEAAVMPKGVRACLGRRMGILRPNREIVDPYFLLYAYLGPAFQETIRQKTIRGATVDRLPISEIGEWEISIPPLPEQQAIAEVLGALDDKIEANRATSSIAEDLARSIADGATGLSNLGSIAQICRHAVPTTFFRDQTVEHFSLPAFDDGRSPRKEPGDHIKSGKFLLDGPTVLVSKLNPHIPRVWMAMPSGDVPALTSTEFVGLVPSQAYGIENLWAVCSTPKFSSQLGEMVKGTTGSHQRVSPEDLLDLKVPDPRLLGDAASAPIMAAVQVAAALRRESVHLAVLRDTLLPKLLSGELRVKEADAMVEERV